LPLGIDEDGEVAVEPGSEKLEAPADGALTGERERVREDRREEAVQLVAEDVSAAAAMASCQRHFSGIAMRMIPLSHCRQWFGVNRTGPRSPRSFSAPVILTS